jgi:hypothetical protein
MLALDDVEWGCSGETVDSIMIENGWTPTGASRHSRADAIECRTFSGGLEGQRLDARASFWRGHLIAAEVTCVADSMDGGELQRRLMANHEKTCGKPSVQSNAAEISVHVWPKFAQGIQLTNMHDGSVVRLEFGSRLHEILVDHDYDPYKEWQHHWALMQMMIADGVEPDHIEFTEQRLVHLEDVIEEIESAEQLIGFRSSP